MLQLVCHTKTPARTVKSIGVATEYTGNGKLWVRYCADCDLDNLETGTPKLPARAENLWQTTCFEAFVRKGTGTQYIEFNFAPSGEWAAYRFDDYREGMTELALETPPEIRLDASQTHFALEATLILPDDWQMDTLQMALSAVMQETGGTKSFWALVHSPGKPDFHKSDCFTHRLSAARRP